MKTNVEAGCKRRLARGLQGAFDSDKGRSGTRQTEGDLLVCRGVLSEISPVNCSLSVAQKIAVKIVDIQISKTRNGHKRNRDCSVGFFSGAEGLSERKLNRLLKCPILTTAA
jgi:hypothetical protein